MQISAVTLLALAGAALAAPGFKVPAGQPDGSYSVYRHDNGTDIHEPIGNGPHGAKFRRTAAAALGMGATGLKARDDIPPGFVTCGGGQDLDPADTDAANAELDAQCGGWTTVKAGLHFYSIVGGTVAYFCNFAPQDYGCSNGVRGKWSAEITAACGRYKPGWVTDTEGWSGWGGTSYSYGYEPAQNEFCGCGTGC